MYKITRYCFVLVICFNAYTSRAQKQPGVIATIEVTLNKPASGLDIPVQADLDAITFLPDSVLALYEVTGTKKTAVPFQVGGQDHRTLYWLVKSSDASQKKKIFQLIKGKPSKFDEISATADNGALIIHNGSQNLLSYFFKTVYPPAGIDSSYKRSGFIHPLWSPHGQELTRIQAPDHYHHYGLWNPWTHVLYKQDTVDFWNLHDGKGTVRFAKFASQESGPVFAEFEALHEHVVFHKGGSEETAINELQTVRIYRPGNRDYYIADFTFQMNCATENPVLLLAYRYGGFGWRATQQWNKDNSEVLTSEGKTRKEADGSKARWCIVQGKIDDDYAGAIMLSYPANYNHPEPLRIWPETMNNRGDMFANFDPTKDMDWLLKPGQNYTLRYRLIVFNGHTGKEKAESAWQYFANPPVITIKKN